MGYIEYTQEQLNLIDAACRWFNSGTSSQLFEYSAPAGAGKSLVMHEIINRLGLDDYTEVAPMCYTGTASLIMRLNGFSTAKTCHSWLYNVVDVKVRDPRTGRSKKETRFIPKPLPSTIKLICVDEASMIPENIGKEIMKRRVKVLVCGDLNQLPPVKSDRSYFLRNESRVFRLTKIMRQSANSSIIEIANMVLHGKLPHVGNYGDVQVLTKDELNLGYLTNTDIVICCTNRVRDSVNRDGRQLMNVPLDSPLPQYGEKVVCRSNNWDTESDGIYLTNGMVGTVISQQGIHSMLSRESYAMSFSPSLFPNANFRNIKCDYKYFNANYYRRNDMRTIESPYYRPKMYGHKFELAYAITTHMSQGTQYRSGVFIMDSMNFKDMNKLCYTAVTRFTNFCAFVIPNKKFTYIGGYNSSEYNNSGKFNYFSEQNRLRMERKNPEPKVEPDKPVKAKKCVCSINGVPVM